ncbi:PAS domain-containing protein [Mucilaginibacter robiniae]|uniref:histidine kinase n=1 Tax=Mucilaginibacter robiniae TaxID=2728022 RepID=A0A7L5DVN4_9SPHI|nr:PAS domain-containing sensor histidine kinase [Mucilaginibacter robiniae]QJD95142.1 PAS domain-containing protein [Mucilaginibacter robiniae]
MQLLGFSDTSNLPPPQLVVDSHLQAAMNHIHLGFWELDLKTLHLTCTASCKQNFGLHPYADLSYERLQSIIYEEDLPLMQQNLAQVISRQKEFYYAEYRINHPDGTLHWIQAEGLLITEQDTPVKLAGTTLDITPRKLSDLRKDELLSIVTHEVNTPLTSIQGYLQLLDRMIKTTDQSAKMGQIIQRTMQSAERLKNIIHDYFIHTQSTIYQPSLRMQIFRLDELLNEITDHVQAITSSHEVQLPESLPTVWINGDRQDLGQVINNLLINAIKYSPGRQIVKVDLMLAEATATLSIRDYGMGIATQNLGNLFKKAYRVDYDSAVKGTGMGLYICHDIITRHDGYIGVQSTEGEGSNFYFTLPMITE